MSADLFYNFEPPLTEANISSIRDQTLQSIPVCELEKRAYFESALDSLVAYAIDTEHESRNFSLSIGFFNPKATLEDEDISKKDWVWVEVKVLGGFGLAFRHRYLATQLGVARIDWKRNTSRRIRIEVAKAMGSVKSTVLQEEAKHRSSERLHKKEYTPQDIISHLKTMTRAEFQAASTSEQLPDLARCVFTGLDRDASESLNRKTFLFFWQTLLEQPVEEALSLYEEIVGETKAVSFQQFAELFSIVVGRLVSARERGEGMTAALRDVHISNERNERLNPFYQSKYRRQILNWTCIMNEWMCMRTEDLELLSKDRDKVAETVGKLFSAVEADDQGLTYHQYEILQAGLDRALYQVPLSEVETMTWFKLNSSLLASGTSVITRNAYLEFLQSELSKVILFKQDWECARALDYEVASLGTGVHSAVLEMLYQNYYSRYASGTEIAYPQWVRARRCNCVLDMFEVFHKCNLKHLHTVVSTAANNSKSNQISELEHPGKTLFRQIANLPLEQLHALVLEEYRLIAIAHLVFLTLQPYHQQHDYATFLMYGKQMCAAFQLSEELLLELFNSHATNRLLTEQGFVVCLKEAMMIFRMLKTV